MEETENSRFFGFAVGLKKKLSLPLPRFTDVSLKRALYMLIR